MNFERPEVLLLLLPAAALVVLLAARRRRRFASRGRLLATLTVRLAVLALLALALAVPYREAQTASARGTDLVADRSGSVPAPALRAIEERLAALRREGPTRELPFGGPGDSDARPALLRAAAGPGERIVVATDGRLDADAAALLGDLAAGGAAAGVLPAGDPAPPPLPPPALPAILPPAPPPPGGPLALRVRAPGATSVSLRIDGVEVARAPVEDGEARFDDVPASPGAHEAVVVAEGPGGRSAAAREVRVPGSFRVTVLGAAPDDPLARALAAQGLDVATTTGADPGDARVAVALPGAPLAGAGDALAAFVLRGGGLLAATGTAPGLAALAGTGVADLLPAEARPAPPKPAEPPPEPPPPDAGPKPPPEGASPAKVDKEARTVSVLLVMDRSGSMAGQKVALARAACFAAARTLDPSDRLGILAFNETFEWIRPLAAAGDLDGVRASLGRLFASGGTEIFPAMREAFRSIAEERSGIRHVILVSDGQDLLTGFAPLLADMRRLGITVSTVGVGTDYEPTFLASLAKWGSGRFWDATDPRALPQVVTLDTDRVLAGRPPSGRPAPDDVTAGAPKPPEPTVPAGPERPPEAPPIQPVEVRAAPLPALDGLAFPPLPEVEPVRARFPAQTALESADGAPVLTLWRQGSGRVAHLAADPRAWADWPDVGRFLAQLVRLLAGAEPDPGGPAPEIEVRGDRIRVRTVGEPPELEAAGDGAPRPIALVRTGPGAFEGPLLPGEPGSLLVLRASLPGGGRAVAATVLPPPAESLGGADVPALAALAAAAGRLPGEVPPAPAPRRVPGRQPLHLPLLVAAILLLPVDAAVRRLGRAAGREDFLGPGRGPP